MYLYACLSSFHVPSLCLLWCVVGGDAISVYGTALGLVSSDLALNYSNQFTQTVKRTYAATSCTVVSPNTQIQCVSAPGVGRDFRFLVIVDGGVAAAWSTALMAISYAAPVIQSFIGAGGFHASTGGGQLVRT